MKLSVNILTWNCAEHLKENIDDIMNEICVISGKAELIVVDNGSDDDTEDFMKGRMAVYNNIKYKRLNKNYGISRGKNLGIDSSRGEYIFMLDADVKPVRNSISMLTNYLDITPECDAIGFYANMWSNQKNNHFGQVHHEEFCQELFNPVPYCERACIYYGIFRRKMFDEGLRFSEEGAFGEVGYGWEDFDFYNRMTGMGYKQWVTHINKEFGKYYHAINSSIRVMGRQKYRESAGERNRLYKRLWKK